VVVAVLIAMIIPGVAGAQTIEEQQWHLAALGVPDAHAITRGDGVVVAVVDSGVDGTVPDLAGALLPGTGFGTASGTDGTRDNDGHGTAMATLIAGRGVDGGALGVAPGARILPVSVGADGAKFSTAAVSEGVIWAVDQGADVVNLSLTSLATLTPDLLRAINYALDHDAVVIAGTGNEGEEHIGAPANIKGVIAVSGTVEGNGPWPESNTGPEAVLAAPAQGIVTAMPLTVQSTGYAGIDGTSAATALVSGAAALVRARYPDLDAGNVVNRLIVTATDLMAPGRDSQTGFGLVNPVAALTADVPPVERNPLAPPPRTSSATAPPTSVESLPAPPSESGDQTPVLMAAGGVAAVVLVVALLLVRRNRVRRTPVPVVTEIPPPSDDFWRGDRP
jgi:type VII secretion-associated serine protease mycosin